jgi:hypothetical protein
MKSGPPTGRNIRYEGKRDAYLRCAAALEKAVGRLPFQGG